MQVINKKLKKLRFLYRIINVYAIIRRADFGTWRSLVARLFWVQDVAGSNPVVPTSVSLGNADVVQW